MFLIRFIVKIITFIPLWIFYKPLIYHEKKEDKQPIRHRKCILLINDNSKCGHILLRFLFIFRNIKFLNDKDKVLKRLSKNGVVAFDNFDESTLSLIKELSQEYDCPIKIIYSNKKYGLFKATSLNISSKIKAKTDDTKSFVLFINKTLNNLKKQMEEYKKLHTYFTLSFRWFILDFVRVTSFPIAPIVFPRKRHYLSKDGKKIKMPTNCIIISNHPSFYDPFLMHLYFLDRRIHLITAEELYRDLGKFMCWWFKTSGCIKYRRVSQQGMDIVCFKEACAYLNTNKSVAIFPEGHVHLDGEMKEFSGGAALLAMMSGAPIYPYYSVGKPKAFKKQHLIFGEPINIYDYFEKGTPMNNEVANKFTEILYNKMKELEEYGSKFRKKEN